jgi:hypothetical protein
MSIKTTLLGLTLLAGTATAADANGQFLIVGEGAPTCSAFNEIFSKGDSTGIAKYAAWAHGYTSALNESVNGTYDVLGGKSLDELMVDIALACQADPTQTVHAATRATLAAYYPNRTQTAP